MKCAPESHWGQYSGLIADTGGADLAFQLYPCKWFCHTQVYWAPRCAGEGKWGGNEDVGSRELTRWVLSHAAGVELRWEVEGWTYWVRRWLDGKIKKITLWVPHWLGQNCDMELENYSVNVELTVLLERWDKQFIRLMLGWWPGCNIIGMGRQKITVKPLV